MAGAAAGTSSELNLDLKAFQHYLQAERGLAKNTVLAYGRDFSDVSPLRGVILGGGAHTAEVSVTVTALG